jgi:hypothetical protein
MKTPQIHVTEILSPENISKLIQFLTETKLMNKLSNNITLCLYTVLYLGNHINTYVRINIPKNVMRPMATDSVDS